MREHRLAKPNEQDPLVRVANTLGMALLGYLALGGLLGWAQARLALPAGALDSALSLVRYALSLLLPFGLAGRSLRGVMPPRRPAAQPLSYCLGALLAGTGAACLGNLLAWLLQRGAASLGLELAASGDVLPQGLLAGIITFAGYSLVAALVEEAAFRGVVLGALRPWGEGRAVVFSAVLFALCHGSLLQVFPALFTGLVLGAVTLSTGGIGLAVVIHTCYNALALLANRFASSDPWPVVVFWLGMGLMGLCALPLLRRGREERPAKTAALPRGSLQTAPVMVCSIAVLVLRLVGTTFWG